jgi:hypothetical protein
LTFIQSLYQRRSISGTVIATYQFKQTKTGGCLHIYDAYKADLQTQQEFIQKDGKQGGNYIPDQVKPSHLCDTLEHPL